MGWFSDFLADTLDFASLGLTHFGDQPDAPPPPDLSARGKAALAEEKRLAGVRPRGNTLLTGGLGLEDDEDVIKKKTLLGA